METITQIPQYLKFKKFKSPYFNNKFQEVVKNI
jgi:hypothetical protein